MKPSAKKKAAKPAPRPVKKTRKIHEIMKPLRAKRDAAAAAAGAKSSGMTLTRGYYAHSSATLMGDFLIGKGSSIWPGTVIRADMNSIRIGDYVNIQDNCTLHVDSKAGLTIGDYTLVGHNCMIHSCTIGRACLIGIGSIILEGAVVGDGAMITAGVLLRGGSKVPPGALVIKKDGTVKIYEGKAKTLLTIAASLEYEELAKRAVRGVYGPFSREAELAFVERARAVLSSILPGENA